MTTTSNATPTPGKIALPPRTAARVATVQGLYQMDLAGTDLNDVIDEFVWLRFPRAPGDEAAAGADPGSSPKPIRGVVRRQRDIDPLVDHQLAEGWRLVRIDAIVRAILRAGVFELMQRPDGAPPRRHQRIYQRRALLLLGRRAEGGDRRARQAGAATARRRVRPRCQAIQISRLPARRR